MPDIEFISDTEFRGGGAAGGHWVTINGAHVLLGGSPRAIGHEDIKKAVDKLGLSKQVHGALSKAHEAGHIVHDTHLYTSVSEAVHALVRGEEKPSTRADSGHDEHGGDTASLFSRSPLVDGAGTDRSEVTEYTVTTSRLFTAGKYPGKREVTTADLDRVIAGTKNAPIQIGHAEPEITFGHATNLQRKGRELWGDIHLKPYALAMIEDSGVETLSVGFDPTLSYLKEVSITNYPAVTGSTLFSTCFSAGETPEDSPLNEDPNVTPSATDPAAQTNPETKPADAKSAEQTRLEALEQELATYRQRDEERRKAKLTEEERRKEEQDALKAENEKLKTQILRDKVAAEFKLPAELAEVLRGSDEAAYRAHAEVLSKYAQPRKAGNPADPLSDGSTIPTYTREQLRKDPELARKVAVDLPAGKCKIVG